MRFCKEKAASPDIVGLSGSIRAERFGLFIKLGDRLSVLIDSIELVFKSVRTGFSSSACYVV
jgi:hypothetical protein